MFCTASFSLFSIKYAHGAQEMPLSTPSRIEGDWANSAHEAQRMTILQRIFRITHIFTHSKYSAF